MTNVTLGGHQFTTAEIIAAIQASDNQPEPTPEPQEDSDKYQILQNLVNSLMTRIDLIEKSTPSTRQAFVVARELLSNGNTSFKVRMLNEQGQHIFVTFEVPPV